MKAKGRGANLRPFCLRASVRKPRQPGFYSSSRPNLSPAGGIHMNACQCVFRSLSFMQEAEVWAASMKVAEVKLTGVNSMKRYLGLLIASLFFSVPMLMAQDHSDHVEVGAFVNYFRLGDVSPSQNFFGVGGRVGFALRPSV